MCGIVGCSPNCILKPCPASLQTERIGCATSQRKMEWKSPPIAGSSLVPGEVPCCCRIKPFLPVDCYVVCWRCPLGRAPLPCKTPCLTKCCTDFLKGVNTAVHSRTLLSVGANCWCSRALGVEPWSKEEMLILYTTSQPTYTNKQPTYQATYSNLPKSFPN